MKTKKERITRWLDKQVLSLNDDGSTAYRSRRSELFSALLGTIAAILVFSPFFISLLIHIIKK